MAIYAGLQSLSIYSIQIWIFVLINGRFSNRKKILIKDFLFLLKFIFSFFPSDTAFVLAAVYQKDISEEIFGHFGQKMDATVLPNRRPTHRQTWQLNLEPFQQEKRPNVAASTCKYERPIARYLTLVPAL